MRLRAAWLESHAEWGPGLHEDGFGLHEGDDVRSVTGFAAWLERLESGAGRCAYRWIVNEGLVVGGIALRHGADDEAIRAGGHVGYGIRPSARGRGLATWALRQMLVLARDFGMNEVVIVCAADNTASARTIERVGGVLDDSDIAPSAPLRRYRVSLSP